MSKLAPPDLMLTRLLFHYNSESGVLMWTAGAADNIKEKRAGHVMNKGHRVVSYNGHRYTAQTLIWYIMTGKWPEGTFSFKDDQPTNLSWDNIIFTPYVRKQSGVTGITWSKSKGLWRVKYGNIDVAKTKKLDNAKRKLRKYIKSLKVGTPA